jgi:hypothetical protein
VPRRPLGEELCQFIWHFEHSHQTVSSPVLKHQSLLNIPALSSLGCSHTLQIPYRYRLAGCPPGYATSIGRHLQVFILPHLHLTGIEIELTERRAHRARHPAVGLYVFADVRSRAQEDFGDSNPERCMVADLS